MVAVKIRIAKPTPGVQLKKAVDLPGLTETPVKLGCEGAAEATPATSAKAGVASRHRAMVRARMDVACQTLLLRSGAVVQAEPSSVLLRWWRLAARPTVQYEEHD